jgi:uncharacterized protein (TIGR00375 family)
MRYIADLHVHSHYASATSKFLNLETIYQWALIKGIQVVGTGDFTHPAWFNELCEKLVPDDSGFFRLKHPPKELPLPGMKAKQTDVRFCLSTEICSDYIYAGRKRRNHHLVYAPDFEIAERINKELSHMTDLALDGRPTIGSSSRDLLELILNASSRAHLVPAHVWTPWFSTLGSKGGYDSVEECFRDLAPYIFALETGLSSDPVMNWKWSSLDRLALMSNSDAHSPQNLGREANIFDTELSYDGLFNAVKTGNGFLGTYEFFPEEGKYYHDGHRKCRLSLSPEETIRYKSICPVCGKPLTIGVLHRVQKLADRPFPQQPKGAAGFQYIIPLPEILAEINKAGVDSKRVQHAFGQAIAAGGNEFSLLTEMPVEDIQRKSSPVLAEAIRRMRINQVRRIPGYDGEYGTIYLFDEKEPDRPLNQQISMFEI